MAVSKFTGNKIVRTIKIPSRSSRRRSSGGSSRSDREKRTQELQKQGLDRADASQIALAESKGQTLTNIRPELARKIKSSGTSSKAISSKEVERLNAPQTQSESREKFMRSRGINVPIRGRTPVKQTFSGSQNIAGATVSAKTGKVVQRRTPEKDAISKAEARRIAKRIEDVQKDQIRTSLRSQRAKDIFKIIPGLRGDTFIKEAVRFALSIPAQVTIGIPDQLRVTGRKLAVLGDQLTTPSQRSKGIRELKKSAIATPKEFVKALDPRTPEGLVNMILVASPVLKKGAVRGAKTLKKKDLPKVLDPVTVVKTKNNKYSVVTKTGRSVKVPKKLENIFRKADKTNLKEVRRPQTEIARLEKKVLKKPLTPKENKILRKSRSNKQAKQLDKKINKEVSKALKGRKTTPKEKAVFKKAYANYRQKPTQRNANLLRKVAEQVEVKTGVRTIDAIIARQLAKKRKSPAPKKRRPRLTEKQKLKKFRDELKKKQQNQKKKIERAKTKADKEAQKKGFKDFKEQFTYEQLLKKYQAGDLAVGKKLLSIEKKMAKRKAKSSRNRAKQLKKERNAILTQAVKKIKQKTIPFRKAKVRKSPKSKKINKAVKKLDEISKKRIKTISDFQKMNDLQKVIAKKTKEVTAKGRSPTKTVQVSKTTKKRVTKKKSKLSNKQKNAVKSRLKSITKNVRNVASAIRPASKVENLTLPKVKTLFDTLKISENKIDNINKILPKEDSMIKSAVRNDLKQVQKLKTRVRNIIRSKTPKVKEEIVTKIKLPKVKLSWDKKPPKGFEYLVNPVVRVKGRNRELKLRTTKNRALKKIVGAVDNSLSRSFKLKIVGLTRKKDIKSPPSFKKFRAKRSKGTAVLPVVEKSKFALDSKGEKQRISLAKELKRRKLIKRA